MGRSPRAASLLAVVALLSVGPANALTISVLQPEGMDNHKCKVVCQRFGMRSLGKAFQSIHHPTECVAKCDEVYPARHSRASTTPRSVSPSATRFTQQGIPEHPPPHGEDRQVRRGLPSKAFQSIHHPTEKIAKCDEVYPARHSRASTTPRRRSPSATRFTQQGIPEHPPPHG